MAKISDEIRDWCDFCGYIIDGGDIGKLRSLADRMDRELVELPKDADGEYIHIGDVMEWCDSGETLTVEGIGSDVLFYIDGENAEWTAARNKRHHHEPTVEDVLREFAYGLGVPVADSYVAAAATKLRLAEGVDE